MNLPRVERTRLVVRLPQIAQLEGTYDSKTDQTAQTDQGIETAEEFGAISGQKLTSPHSKLTSRTAQRLHSGVVVGVPIDSAPARPSDGAPPAMSARPIIEAVQRAGGAITLQGDRLRLSAPEPLPENLIQELRTRKAEVIDHLQHARHSRLRQPATEALTDRTAPPVELVAAWVAGVARLREMPPPRNYPGHAWQQLIVDAERFLGDWAAPAHRLDWRDWELFGVHRRAPWGRIQGMGLVLLLRGGEIAALTETAAMVRTPTGARQTCYRQLHEPLRPAERCLVWELA